MVIKRAPASRPGQKKQNISIPIIQKNFGFVKGKIEKKDSAVNDMSSYTQSYTQSYAAQLKNRGVEASMEASKEKIEEKAGEYQKEVQALQACNLGPIQAGSPAFIFRQGIINYVLDEKNAIKGCFYAS